MTMIKDVLDIQRSYSTQVELRSEYYDLERREERMTHYKPIKAHRVAFEKIVEGLYRQKDKRSYILSGSFGTGKSHLLMMAASYFSSPSSTPEMKKFFDNYELAEQEEDIKEKKAAQLRNLRSEGEFLVSICDYASPDFETNLLRALRDTLEKKEIDPNTLESEYLQAYGKIQAWSDSEDAFFIERLEKLLDAEGEKWSISSLQSALSDFDVDALDTFKKLYKKVTSTDFQYDKDNYVEVISQMVKSPQIRDKYKGWVILFDEFDYQVGEKRFHLGQFQRFLAMCSESLMNGFPIMFIAAIHKSFLDYKSVYNSNDFTTISDRLDEIKLESEGVEDIISAVVNPKKDSDIWKNEIAPKASEVVKLANETNTHHLFDWLKAAQIKSKIIENIYPMHPAATYALIKLAGAAGSNNRSVVTFFADEREERGSYAYFINHTEVEQGGMLNLYTVDALCDYFDLESSSENITDVAKEYIRNYETSLRELARIRHTEMDNLILSDNLFERVLKVMVIYDVIGLANTPELIRFGLNMTTSSRAGSLDNVLKLACEKKIIYLNDTNGCYEFKRSDSKDISGLIRDYKSKPENLPDNYISALESVLKYDFSIKSKKKLKGEPLSPQKYNLLYREDKRLKKVFCMLKDIEDPAYFDDIHNELEAENDHKKNFDGAIVYVICEKNDEIDKATSLTKNNKYKEIMVAVCNEVAEIYDDIFSLVAACHYEDNSSDFSSQDLRALKEQAQTYDTKIAKRLDFIMDSKNYKAYGAFGEMLENGANDVGAAALLENIFKKKRNAFSHDDLNKSHEYKENNIALRDAVDMLLEVSQKMSYHMDYGQDRGDIKYIKNVLIQNGVLYSTNTNGSIAYCEIELDIEKYKTVIPALHDMIKEVHDRENEDINIQKFVQKYRKEYGLGNNSLLLFMAVLRKYYSDALSIVKDVTAVGSISVNNMEMLKAVLLDPAYSNCIMKYESISEEEEEYIQKLMEIFGGNGKNANLESLHQLMSGWYASLDSICKASDIYCEDATKKFVGICNRMETTPIRELVLYDMKDIIGIERDDLIHGSIIEKLINEVTKQKEIVANGYSLVRKRVIAGLATLFGNPTENIEELKTSFFEWSAGLDEAQKDVLNQLQNDDSKPIAKAISLDLPFATVILESIPTDMHFGVVKTWTSDQVDDYINAFKRGKTHIENNVYSVSCPKYTAKGVGVEESENGRDRIIKFSGEVDILIDLGEDNVCFYITTDGTNPTDSDAQREKRISSYIMKITSDTNIRLCGVSESGKYSSVLNLQCRNEETKYEVKVVPVQQRLKLDGSGGVETSNDIKLDAIVPIDSVSLCLCVKSIAELMKSSHDVTTDEIISGLKKAIEELGE